MNIGQFTKDGKGYEITTPITPSTWTNYLFNDEYHMEVSQTLQGKSSIVKSYNRENFTTGYRYFYILNHETKQVFNPNYVPLRRKLDNFVCVHGLNETSISSECDGIACDIKTMVPTTGYGEIWTVRLKNMSDREQEISLFSVVGFEDPGVMGGECVYNKEKEILYKYAFPYHVFYEDKEKAEKNPSYYYMISNVTPSSCDMSTRRFFGCDDVGEYPLALKKETCSNIDGEAENFCGCLQHKFHLKPGVSTEYYIRIGIAYNVEEICTLKEELGKEFVQKKEAESKEQWERLCGRFTIHTPDENLNSFANYWLKKQITLLTRQNRGSVYCPVRNQLQDAMGYSVVDPAGAKDFVYRVLSLQQKNGFITQWYMTDGSPKKALCLLKHTDGPLWLILSVITMINQNGDESLFKELVDYKDAEAACVYEHLLSAAFYMYQHRGAHGLCLMGDGDWNDPINGTGRRGKGESTWSTLALIYGIGMILESMDTCLQGDMAEKLKKMQEELRENVNKYCWSEDRYVAGYDDDGITFGSVQDNDRLFLNTQTWAIIAGVPDRERLAVMCTTMERLATPFGPLLLDPPFTEWDQRWGRVSIKKSGTTENGSVYCHASMFKAFSDAIRKDGEALYDTLKKTLPTNPDNPPENNRQLPVYIANYYYALKGSANYGRSSCHYGTGTVAWMLLIVTEMLLGVRTTVKGVEINPCLPDSWDHVHCIRKYKDAVYHVTICKGEERCIIVNGRKITGKVLPYEPGGIYEVEVYR